MSDRTSLPISRRTFLGLSSLGALGLAGGAAWAASSSAARPAAATRLSVFDGTFEVDRHLAATDGHVLFPGRGSPNPPGNGAGSPVYIFGFVDVPVGAKPNQLAGFKGNVKLPAPIIDTTEGTDVRVTVTNIGLVVRPDLDDSHTLHWHGFPNQEAIFDGVPEVSIAVPPGRGFPYYYNPRRVGTFMYHCHFEDVEHVQMGMQGIVFVRPTGFPKRAYASAATAFDREFCLLLDEIWTTPHDNLESIQETVWPLYKANYWTINGRSYPDTVLPNNHASLPSQPLSSLMQVNGGERILMRMSNLGYEQQAMQLPGVRLTVVGEDATLLDNFYDTNTIYIGPGEARDVLFSAPSFSPSASTTSDAVGTYNRYYLRNRAYSRLTNGGNTAYDLNGLGGQITELRVYQGAPLPSQTSPNQTFPA